MKNFKILTVLTVLLLAFAVLFVSCDKSGDDTTAAPESTLAPSVTDAPTESADETTSAPETTVETTANADETTKAAEVTEAPHTHSFGAWSTVKASSCTEEGSQERTCSCGEKETQTVAKTAHREGAWITDKDATCTDAGSKHIECEICKNTVKTESIPAKGHTDGAWIIDKEATATADGSKHLECSVCKATVKTEAIPASPHTPGSWIVDKEPTCTETGLRHRACTKCGETVDTEVVSAKGHTTVTDAAKAATCTADGITAGKHCSVCNVVIEAQQKVPAKGHSEVTDVAKAATCTEEGLTEGKHCSVCNAVTKAQNKIPAKGHTEVVDAAKEATCTATGLTEGKHCSVCNAVVKAQETVPVKAHTESDWIIDKAATTAAEGSKHIECTVCKTTVKTEVIPKVEIPKIDYTVTVKYGNGTAASGVEVVFTKGTTEAAKIATDSTGKAVVKLEEGEYGIEIVGNESYFISYERASLTAAAPAAEVLLIPYAENPQLIYPAAEEVEPNGDTYGVLAGVYDLGLGTYRITVEKDKMRYIFFRPTEGAIYHITTDSDKVDVGYYGGSFFVTPNNTGTILSDGTLEIEFLRTAVGNTLVIGLESTSASVTECSITIVKHQDIGLSLEELEWTPYKPDAAFEKIETPEGNVVGMDLAVWTPLDSTATEIPVFFNEKDGYYHLNSVDGPVLYVRIGSKSSYQEALTTIVGTSNLGRYIYDENGNFVMKERYNEIIMAYANAADIKYNVYPLTEDLYYILKGLGDIGWYDKTSPNYIFKEEEIIVMPFNGWLFACVYFK